MEENSVFLERLLVLRMTSFEILVIPSAAVPQRKHGVICIGDGNGLPVLSVEDLAHSSISIPYMECDDPPTNLKFVFFAKFQNSLTIVNTGIFLIFLIF